VCTFNLRIPLAIAVVVVSSCDLELLPMTLTFERDLDAVRLNQCTQYLSQRPGPDHGPSEP